MSVIVATGPLLDRVLDSTCRFAHDGLVRQAYGTLHAALTKTVWGQRCQRPFALVEGDAILASAEQYDLTAVLDGRTLRVCGFGPVFVDPTRRGQGHARRLVDTLLSDAERDGAEMALLLSSPGNDDEVGDDFDMVPFTDLLLEVAQSARHGAPMTMVRGGEERDLAAIVAMGRTRAEPVRFHLDRDVDFVQYVLTRKRLLAGLGSASARQLHFFIAEEGITAAVYVVLSVAGHDWTLEECGDRDPSGARVGALLQALIAREPGERRPAIKAWLPPGFLPPQVTIASATSSAHSVRVRMLGSRTIAPPLTAGDVLFWRSDLL